MFFSLKKMKAFSSDNFNRKQSEIRFFFLRMMPLVLSAIICGLLAVLYARLFSMSEDLMLKLLHSSAWLLFVVSPICFVLSYVLVHYVAPYSGGSGIPQVMAGLEMPKMGSRAKLKKIASLRVLFIKVLSSLLLVLGGGGIGREGPTIQVCASVFKFVKDLLPKNFPRISRKNMLMTGAAAGLAAAFNTPLGGVVFAVEELSRYPIRYFRRSVLLGVIVAGLTAEYIAGPYLYLGSPRLEHVDNFMYLLVIFISLLGGALGRIHGILILWINRWKRVIRKPVYRYLYLIVSALIIVSIGKWFSETILGSGKSLMSDLLFAKDKSLPWYAPVFRGIGPLLSFTSGGSGGVFAPSLSAGAAWGGFLSGLFHLSSDNANLLILCGMVGYLTGMTGTPLTSAVLVLEMTDRSNIIIPLILAGLMAAMSANLIDRKSFYEHMKDIFLVRLDREEKRELMAAASFPSPSSNKENG